MRHHGESLRALTKDPELVASLEHDPYTADLEARARAIVDYALKLTRTPDEVSEADVAALREAGLSDAAVHDVAAVTAYFNFVNRMASGLGVEIERE